MSNRDDFSEAEEGVITDEMNQKVEDFLEVTDLTEWDLS